MTLNQFGVTAEANDRLLELMGGCRHEWVMADFVYLCCQKCRAYYPKTDDNYPAVGDGHAVTLGELVRLADKLNRELWGGNATICVWMQNGIYKASVQIECGLWEQGDDYYESDDCDTPEAALAAAILAAVDQTPQLDPTVKRGDIGKAKE